MTEISLASSPMLTEAPCGPLIDPHLLAFVLTHEAARAEQVLATLLEQHALPIIARVVGREREAEDLRREILSQVRVLLRAFKAAPTINPIANFSHSVVVIATTVCRAEQRRLHPRPSVRHEDEAAFEPALLTLLWREIECLPARQRLAYLLNFTDGEIDWFWLYGIASVRQIGKTLQFTNEQFNRVWVLLEWNEEPRERARLLTNYDEKFALLWQQLPLNDLTIAALLETTQANVIHLRQAARQRLRRKINNANTTAQPEARP